MFIKLRSIAISEESFDPVKVVLGGLIISKNGDWLMFRVIVKVADIVIILFRKLIGYSYCTPRSFGYLIYQRLCQTRNRID